MQAAIEQHGEGIDGQEGQKQDQREHAEGSRGGKPPRRRGFLARWRERQSGVLLAHDTLRRSDFDDNVILFNGHLEGFGHIGAFFESGT